MIYVLLDYLKRNILLLIIILLNLILISLTIYFNWDFNKNLEDNTVEEENIISVVEDIPVEKEVEKILVDIKGYVKKAGVYEVSSDTIVNDCIKLAGGIKTEGDTNTINLSKKVFNEMVIYVPEKKKEITEDNIPNDALVDNNTSVGVETNHPINTKVNINTASIEELLTLDGIGESKAQAIIDYRNEVGLFKSIEELKNVSGIGDTVFENIKDNITV